jgi:Acylphosphatases
VEDKVRVHVFIEGIVQGVSFRYYTYKLAKKYKVNGWIRNLPDGRVEAVFEGDKSSVDKLVEFCKKGPEGALVTNIEIIQEKFLNEFKNFEILYD